MSEGSTEIIDSLRQGHVSYVINTIDINQHNTRLDGYEIRRTAVENNVTIFTALETVKVLLDVLEEITLGVSTLMPNSFRFHAATASHPSLIRMGKTDSIPHLLQVTMHRICGLKSKASFVQRASFAPPRSPRQSHTSEYALAVSCVGRCETGSFEIKTKAKHIVWKRKNV